MDFDSMDGIVTLGSKDHHHSMIMKGKRTKRPRQPSPASAVFTASSCSSGGDAGAGSGGEKTRTKIRSSESLCSEISTTTDEDEDMANCLILLAQSGGEKKMSTPIHVINNIEEKEKNSSRRLKELTITTSSTVVGKAGIYVYECKTCNRSFPSFQALGGHRTSHKKHKPTGEMEEKRPKMLPPLNDDHHHHHQEEDGKGKGKKFHKTSPSSLLPLEIAKKNYHGDVVINNISKVKIHECSICGSEFSSGQALGGHMRRHRNPASATTSTTEASHDGGEERPRNILELDLNLPAPPEEDHHDSQFQFSLLPAPSLVDCQ